MKPTGTHIGYYFTCLRKLWLFYHGIHMEHTSDLVYEGKMIGENTYSRRHSRFREVELGHIKIDFYDPKHYIIHEIKKSKKLERSHEWQLKYYVHEAREAKIEVRKGILEYPKLKQTQEVFLSDDVIMELNKAVQKIQTIVTKSCPPVIHKKICKKCSYYDFCYAGEEELRISE